ncbi:unannotated protein [freshwater metagenome]|uniref:Unannotated protein n=1 Tax=freshwater metagenome TaxID=449393 RepID=A0A6J7AVI6_9ZZZZ
MDDDHVALAAEVDDLLHERDIDAHGGGIVRERDHEHARLGPGVLVTALQVVDELVALGQRDFANGRPGEDGAPDVDGVGRSRHEREVAGLQQGPHEVGEPFLRADGVDDLGGRVEMDTPAPQVHRRRGLAELGDTLARRVSVVASVVRSLGELLDRDVGRGQIGVAEPEVDHVATGSPGFELQRIDNGEYVGRQRVDATELHGRQR